MKGDRRRRYRVVALAAGGALAGYLVLLVVVGWATGGMVARDVRARLAASLDADADVGGARVSLVRGAASIRDISVRREHDGYLSLDLDRLDLDVAPLGAVLWDRDPRAVSVRGGRLEVTGLGVLRLPRRPAHPPIRVGALALDDCAIVLATAGMMTGLTRVQLTIERARSGETVLRTALSWLFTLQELVARVELAGGVTVRLEYRGGVLSAAGGPFGAVPVVIPFEIPPAGDDEVEQLAAIGKQLGKELAMAEARRVWRNLQ
ncbi:MAG TPA: hypothetical protein VHE35_01980 [Kofleriaceae bacterium]|nr:hypothetical protein [Kofleriaceae bacterium]